MYSTAQVDFHGQPLVMITIEDKCFVAMKPIVEGMGLEWSGQQKKLNNQREKFGCVQLLTTGKDGKKYKMLCIPLDKINEFLATINPNKRKPSGEINYVKELCEKLSNIGWNIKVEKQVTFGKIDIFATRRNKTMIIEAKLSARAYTSALGQLLAYKESFPDAMLVFACKEDLNDKKKIFLGHYGVTTISSVKDLQINCYKSTTK